MTQNQLCQHLKEWLALLQQSANQLVLLEFDLLNNQPAPNKWSAAQCLDHLNQYNAFYVTAMQRQLKKAEQLSQFKEATYKAGLLGNWFANQMKPEKGLIKSKMKAPKDKRPSESNYDISVLESHQQYLAQYLPLLDQSSQINLNKNDIGITLSRFIKMRFGDTLRFNIYHMLRHCMQYEKALKVKLPNFNDTITKALLQKEML